MIYEVLSINEDRQIDRQFKPFKTMPTLDDHPNDMGPLLPAVVAAQK